MSVYTIESYSQFLSYREEVLNLFSKEKEDVEINTPFLDERKARQRADQWLEAKGVVPLGPCCDLW